MISKKKISKKQKQTSCQVKQSVERQGFPANGEFGGGK